ncbi:hypothetical protein FCV25MIE_09304 [Fagus crenata]
MSIEDTEARERLLGDTLKGDSEHEQTSDSSSSSSDGSNEPRQNQLNSENRTQSTSSLLQRPRAIHEAGIANAALVTTSHMQQAGRSLPNSTSIGTTPHFPPTTVQPSQQDGALQPLSLVQDMNLIPRNQLGLSSQSAFHAEHMLPSRTSGIVNHGILFPIDHPTRSYGSLNTYHLPTSNLPPEFRLESSLRMQLPQIQQPQSQASAPQLLGSGSGGSPFTKTQWANWHPQNQITMHETSTAMGYRKFNMSVYN